MYKQFADLYINSSSVIRLTFNTNWSAIDVKSKSSFFNFCSCVRKLSFLHKNQGTLIVLMKCGFMLHLRLLFKNFVSVLVKLRFDTFSELLKNLRTKVQNIRWYFIVKPCLYTYRQFKVVLVENLRNSKRYRTWTNKGLCGI